jgi:ATPase subunit of ABC transporter with duplicated ATPase domains
VLVVSHDAALVGALAAEVWAVEGGGARRLRGGLPEYERRLRAVRAGKATM